MAGIYKKYQEMIENHLNMYNNSILQVAKKYLSCQYESFLGPLIDENYIKKYPKWNNMAHKRMRFLIDWLIRNEIFVRAYNMVGKNIKISTEDSDNAGKYIYPKDPIAQQLICWYNKYLNDTNRIWNYFAIECLDVEDELHKWYRKLCCTKVKMDAGCYITEEQGKNKWNKCVNMLRIQYILLAVIQETRIFLININKILDGKDKRIRIYRWSRELLFAYRDTRRIYLDSDEDINDNLHEIEISDDDDDIYEKEILIDTITHDILKI